MSTVKNVLFIMADQLRWDYLSCYGHPTLKTPNIDKLAKRGVKFNRAYCQSPVCGPSRMSTYTGKYARTHGATWNDFPLGIGHTTLGDHMRQHKLRTALVGKTHVRADLEGLDRAGVDPDSPEGVFLAQGGFEPYERDDGFYHPKYPNPPPAYLQYLRDNGFEGENPWLDWANSSEDEEGNIVSGFVLRSANYPSRLPEEHTETPYTTRRAMDFIDEAGDEAWCLHLSYIKPHWPIVASEPYASMYSTDDMQPIVRNQQEKDAAHPVYKAFMNRRVSKTYSRPEVTDSVVPVYMGLIKQIDDQLGVLFEFMEERNLFDNTMIVFTSDHGDYLGDHWMGEKDLFHEPSVKVPQIIYDPRPQADVTRGTECDQLVESIDLIPTFVEAVGGTPNYNQLEGRSLQSFLHGITPSDWRSVAISEYDYSMMPARIETGQTVENARMVMLTDERWKFIYCEGYRPMLYDLQADPSELRDLGAASGYEEVKQRFTEQLLSWALKHHATTTVKNIEIEKKSKGGAEKRGVFLGYWDESELPES